MVRTLSVGVVTIAVLTSVLAGQRTTEPSYEARIRRTSYGIPHIEARDLPSLGFGDGYAQAEDHLCTIAEQVLEARGEQAKYLGRGERDAHLQSDIVVQALRAHERWDDLYGPQSAETQAWMAGFAAGYNTFLKNTGTDAISGWCRGQEWLSPISAGDLASIHIARTTDVLIGNAAIIANAQPPSTTTTKPAPTAVAWNVDAVGGSNGWAIGRALSANRRGMLLANPHYPWVGPRRFWEKHLTIPGDLDVYGVSITGVPGVIIGFNKDVAWTQTIASGVHATVYALDLVPGAPTRYRYDGEERSMTPVPVSVAIRGQSEPLQRTVWFSQYGPVIAPPGVPWSTTRALSQRTAVNRNVSAPIQWLAMSRARSMADLQRAHATYQANPIANTIAASAAGEAWYVDSSARPDLSATATARWLERRATDPLTRELGRNGIVLLDGSHPDFEWQTDTGAPGPGLIPFRRLPQLLREDYVFNANGSFEFVHATARIAGVYSPLYELLRESLSTRTRNNVLQLSNAAPYTAAGADGKFTLAEIQAAVLSNRSLMADLLVPDLVERCKAAPRVTLDGSEVDVTNACTVLGAWDRRFDLDSRGAVLFREWLANYAPPDFRDAGRMYAVPLDAANPIHTPRGLAAGDLALLNLARTLRLLDGRRIPLDVPLGELQYARDKLPKRIPIHGGTNDEGLLNLTALGPVQTIQPLPQRRPVKGSRVLTEDGYPIAGGTSFLMALEYTDSGPNGVAILTYSQSSDPASEHFSDQTELYSQKRWRPVLFNASAIAADTKREYRVTSRPK